MLEVGPDALDPVGGGGDEMAGAFQHASHRVALGTVVVDDQDRAHRDVSSPFARYGSDHG